MTGVAVAKSILEQSVKFFLHLFSNGATARNGGHIKTAPYSEYAWLQRELGPQKARDIVAFELAHVDALLALGAEHECGEVREVQTVDVFIDEGEWEAAKDEVGELEEAMPEVRVEVVEGDEARSRFGLSRPILGAIAYRAGALWPFRLVASLWTDLAHRYADRLRIRTHCPVTAVSSSDKPAYPLSIVARGATIAARHVVHATNAFAPQLVPELRQCLTGVLGHMTAQRAATPVLNASTSCSIIYGPDMYDYATHRANDTLVGGGLYHSIGHGIDQFGVWDDSRIDHGALAHVSGSMPAAYAPRCGPVAVLSAWSGIMAFTGDGLPFVGQVPPTDGSPSPQWVAAGYCGSGMVWAWLSGTALGSMILARPLDPSFPMDNVKMDEDRLERANLRHLVSHLYS
ncbi:hypothetical protein CDD82_6421 [Ophiocordyceps australis]|uniref:FAD dependent oxidoreductase domain-containing protein n=1 Tax=Ophiocordyceps australis TaxID=1399860 RepID=A0A2C5YQ17_9HYPO|nr:hypothetical protein CDD82_6421 [Ophiocordyceps australis]